MKRITSVVITIAVVLSALVFTTGCTKEEKVVDPFDSSNFTLTFSGLNGHGDIEMNYENNNDYTIEYEADKTSDLANGDTVTITASLLYDDGYILKDSEDGNKTATKEFTVEGLGKIPSKLNSSVDTTLASEAIIETLNEEFPANIGDVEQGFVFGIGNDNFENSIIKIKKVSDFKLEKTFYRYKDYSALGGDSCKFAQIYSRTFTVKINVSGYDSKLKNGVTKSVTAYYLGSFYGGELMVSDNKLVQIDEEDDLLDSVDCSGDYGSIAEAQEDCENSFRWFLGVNSFQEIYIQEIVK